MKGLLHIPSTKDLVKAYGKLQDNLNRVSPKEWALWSQWSRFDARLGEQLVFGIYKHWKNISSVELNNRIREQPWPAAFGVILEQVKLGFVSREENQKLFQHWSTVVMFKVEKALSEQFFIGTIALGTHRMLRQAVTPTKPYVKWGYLGQDLLWNKLEKMNCTMSSKNARLNVVDEMIRQKKRITVKDYVQKLDGYIHVRQAERDLSAHPGLKAVGNTRGRYYLPR